MVTEESEQLLQHTFAIMAVLAPSLAAMTHWLAPFPPNPLQKLEPLIVSPGLGSLGT